jgi:hypothetical protein
MHADLNIFAISVVYMRKRVCKIVLSNNLLEASCSRITIESTFYTSLRIYYVSEI